MLDVNVDEETELPLTAVNVVKMIVIELVVIEIKDGEPFLIETQEGVTVEEVVAKTGAKLTLMHDLSV